MSTKRFQVESRINRRVGYELLEDRLALSSTPMTMLTVDTQYDTPSDTAFYSSMSADELEAYGTLINPGADSAKKYDALTGLDSVKNLYGLDGSGQTVVVIDSGIAYGHTDLGGGFGSDYRVVGGYDFAGLDADPYDGGAYGGHGTHVAGIIASQSAKYPGVAQGVDLVALRIFSDDGSSNLQYLVDALRWVHEHKDSFENPITTINLSIGYQDDALGYYNEINKWFKVLNDDGIFISVAAGNAFQSMTDQNQLSYPAISEYVVAVGSCDTSGDISYFSQRNQSIIVAPGQQVKSTVPDYAGNNNGIDDDYSAFSGTSMAAPYVAGASTLIRQAMYMVGMTNVTQSMIYQVMVTTADTLFDAVTGKSFARLNIKNAIESILPKDMLGNSIADATDVGSVVDTFDINSFFNTKTDCDYFSLTATKSGTMTIAPTMTNGLIGTWDVSAVPNAVVNKDGTVTFDAVAGQKYKFGFQATGTIGAYTINAKYAKSESGTGSDSGNDSNEEANDNTADNNTGDNDDANSNNSDNNTNNESDNNTDSNTNNNAGNETDDNTDNGSNTGDNGTDTGNNNSNDSENQDDDQNAIVDKNSVTVDQATLDHQRLTDQGTWYALTATNTGIMTVEIALPSGVSPSDVIIESGDQHGSVTATNAGTTRIDLNITAGTTAWVRISSVSGKVINDAALRLTNLVRKEGTQVFVTGTNRDDNISYVAGTTQSVTINGVVYTFDVSVTGVNIDSGTGNDTISLTGTSGTDSLIIDGTTVNMSGDKYQVNIKNGEYILVNGQGGDDAFRYYDTVGSDQVTVRTGEITVASERFSAKVNGFAKFYAYSNRGGNDSALLFDSPDNDTFNVNATYTQFCSGGTTTQLYSFASVIAHSSGGTDTATFTDTGKGDLFNGSFESTKRWTATTNQSVEARNFTQVNLTSIYGGRNTVQLEDSRGNDTLYLSANNVSLNGERYGISVRGFDYIHTSSVNGGFDQVMIYDTDSGKKLTANKNTVSLIDAYHEYSADGFKEVWAFGSMTESSKISKNNTDFVLKLLGFWEDNV